MEIVAIENRLGSGSWMRLENRCTVGKGEGEVSVVETFFFLERGAH